MALSVRVSTEPAVDDAGDSGDAELEARLSQFFADYAGRRTHRLVHVLQRPAQTARALGSLSHLPLVVVRPGAGVEGEAVREGLEVPLAERLILRGTRSALAVPADPAEFSLGSSKQTLRRKVRQAERAGVTWRSIDDPSERAALAEVANRHEREHPDQRYRNPEAHNERLIPFRLWLAAFDEHGDPLMLTVLPYDGEWAVLRHFRQLQDTPDASVTRYLMTQVAVEQLSERGVRHLFDEASPQWLDNGLRHFQRMVGFRLVRTMLVSA